MSDVEWAFPGPEPYTYMHASPEFFGITTKDPHELGVEYVKHLMLWRMGIEAGKKVDVSPEPGRDVKALGEVLETEALVKRNLKAQPMVGDKVTVAGIEFTKVGENPFAIEGDAEAAEALLKRDLGATVVESDAPWNNKGMTLTAEKPWEKKASTIDIDI